MVSLNEKRSKTRYVVQNKTDWAEDGNKFGQKMLEKMGWQSGLGLGKNKDGRTEHIDLKFKSNLKGIGFINGKYDDTWITHSQSFDSVLEQLQLSHPSNCQTSLHNFNETIQQTKTRFTYKKQSSGKDLSLRTNDELDSIFGWNKSNQMKEQAREEKQKESERITDNRYVTSTKSLQDYFKEKSLKKAQRLFSETQSIVQSSSCEEESIIEKNSKRKRSDSIEENPYPSSNLSELIGYQGWNIQSSFEEILKKKKKRKKLNL